MRKLILERIEKIRYNENGFCKNDKKWDNFSTGTIKTHISDINFNKCNDIELLILFERIIRRYNK